MTRALRLRLLPLAWLLACVACGGASPAPAEPTAAPAANGEEAGPDEPGASAAPSEAATEPGSAPPAALRELLAAERVPRDEWVGAMPSPTEAIADCPAWEHEGEPDEYWFEECGLRETLGRTAAGWLALEIDCPVDDAFLALLDPRVLLNTPRFFSSSWQCTARLDPWVRS